MILVCGESLVDLLVAPEPGGTSSLDAHLGGAPFNLAIGLARLGQRVALFSGVSTDPFGEAIVQRLAKEGVDRSLLQRSEAATMLALVGVGPDGQPSYFFPISDGADKRLSSPAFPKKCHFVAAAFGSYLAMFEPAASLMRDVARLLRPDTVICLDPNVRLSMVADPELWRRGIEAFLPLSDIVKVSEEDVRLVYGADADSLQIAEDWLSLGPSLIVVTRGAEPAAAVFANGTRLTAAPKSVAVVDTVGAGDAFFAGLIDALERHRLLSRKALSVITMDLARDSLQFATTLAAMTCTRRGADLPFRSDLTFSRQFSAS